MSPAKRKRLGADTGSGNRSMKTTHRIFFEDSRKMHQVPAHSVDLVVTSPPYPMVAVWDEMFSGQNPVIKELLFKNAGWPAFENMHCELDPVWSETFRILKPGGIACINIGDATRTLGGNFALYPNHARVLKQMTLIGFTPLPLILWRKQTNAPNKFMGSGMLPPGAYVTLEHEYILIFRKGEKRRFKSRKEINNRRESSYFWEERNQWFSDIWTDLKGAPQKLADNRVRGISAAYPFELPYRLINMFSVKGDVVADPFLGTGTTMAAAMAGCRNSIGYEIDRHIKEMIHAQLRQIVSFSNSAITKRIKAHAGFVKKTVPSEKLRYINSHYGFPVVSKQETTILLNPLASVSQSEENCFVVSYLDHLQID